MEYSKVAELRNIYFDNIKEAKKGKRILDSFIKSKDTVGLAYLLRHHSEEDITEAETWQRDYIDSYLDFYSVIGLAFIVGFIELTDIEKDQAGASILFYLDNEVVKRYYTKHYPILLPQLLLLLYKNKIVIARNDIKEPQQLFHQFHQIIQSISNTDVNQFLWFLDGGANDNFDIDDLNQTLRNSKRCLKVINGKKNALKESIFGFFDYSVFIEIFYSFLSQIENEIIRSAFWHYQGYWIKKIQKELKGAINSFFIGQTKSIKSLSKAPSHEMLILIKESKHQYINNINDLLNIDYQKPLKRCLNFLNNHTGEVDLMRLLEYERAFDIMQSSSILKTKSLSSDINKGGFDEFFLGKDFKTPLPTINNKKGGYQRGFTGSILSYTHFSIAMNRTRGLCLYGAYNVESAQLSTINIKSQEFKIDARFESNSQADINKIINGPEYKAMQLVSTRIVIWGSLSIAKRAATDTYYLTNVIPVFEHLDTTLWFDIENYYLQQLPNQKRRITVFTGPIFKKNDPVIRGWQIPTQLFKILAFVDPETNGLNLRGYLMFTQEHSYEGIDVDGLFDVQMSSIYEVDVAHIEKLSGLNFSFKSIKNTVFLENSLDKTLSKKVTSLEDISFNK